MKDWTGNQRSIYTTLGASNHTDKEREVNDYYATESKAIDALLDKAILSNNLWECACGAGDLSKRLSEKGYNVKSTDLIYRGFGVGGLIFYKVQNNLTEILSQIHHTNMQKSLLNTH